MINYNVLYNLCHLPESQNKPIRNIPCTPMRRHIQTPRHGLKYKDHESHHTTLNDSLGAFGFGGMRFRNTINAIMVEKYSAQNTQTKTKIGVNIHVECWI